MFSGGVYVGKHTFQATSVRAKASARGGLHPLEKMLAFLRSVSKFFDTLKAPADAVRRGFVYDILGQAMGATPRVIASSTSSTMRTVSREVNIVAPCSTAQRRIRVPSW